YRLETISLRYFNVFGPRQDPSSQYSGVVSRFISALLNKQRPVIFGDGEQSRDFTYIANVVSANLKAANAQSGFGSILNVANGERISLNQLLEELKTITGNHDAVAEYKEPRVGDVRHSLADISRARELLGYEPIVWLREGLGKTIDWWKTSRFANTQPLTGSTFSSIDQFLQARLKRRLSHTLVSNDRRYEFVWRDVKRRILHDQALGSQLLFSNVRDFGWIALFDWNLLTRCEGQIKGC